MNPGGLLAAIAGVGAGVAAVDAFGIEPRSIDVTTHRIGAPELRGTDYRLVQLSDLHITRVRAFEERIARQTRDLRPDLVVISGDAVNGRKYLPGLLEFVNLLPEAATTVAVMGNWEHKADLGVEALREVYDAAGVTLLVNEVKILPAGDASIGIIGFDDWTAGAPSIESVTGEYLGDVAIAIAHSPVFVEELWGAVDDGRLGSELRLTLSGHTHGGQVNLAGWRPVLPAGSGEYVAGWYRPREPHLYVSRGLGTSVLPVRFAARPEIAVFDFR